MGLWPRHCRVLGESWLKITSLLGQRAYPLVASVQRNRNHSAAEVNRGAANAVVQAWVVAHRTMPWRFYTVKGTRYYYPLLINAQLDGKAHLHPWRSGWLRTSCPCRAALSSLWGLGSASPTRGFSPSLARAATWPRARGNSRCCSRTPTEVGTRPLWKTSSNTASARNRACPRTLQISRCRSHLRRVRNHIFNGSKLSKICCWCNGNIWAWSEFCTWPCGGCNLYVNTFRFSNLTL